MHLVTPTQTSGASVRRFVWSPIEIAPVPTLPNPRLRGKRIVVAGQRSELSNAIATALRFQGAAVLPFDEAVSGAVAAFARTGGIDGIVDLNVEGPLVSAEDATWRPALRRSLALLRECYEDWARESDAQRLFYLVLTQMGGTMGYDGEAVAQPLGGIWAGFAKTLPREIANCNARVLDLSPDSLTHAAELVARELYRPGYFEIGYRNGTRYAFVTREEDAGAATMALTASDLVLLSGGARGIGLALAEDLATCVGCRVVVTGRTRAPDPEAGWVRMADAEFQRLRHERLKAAAGSGGLACARAEIEQLARQRDLARQLARLREGRLPVEYVRCDVTCLPDVRAAIECAGEGLSVVIHNAGVDAPVRLPAKSDEAFCAVVGTKVDGFLNFVRALGERRRALKMFCNVGSLTGRWGGMVGEIDYAAANEALSRLGMWASRTVDYPVKTLCWPTWDRLGMIKNFEVAATYSSALNVAEGVKQWRRELVTPRAGEVMFMGTLGNLGSPVYLKAFPPAEGIANISALYTQYHYLGEVLRFSAGRELVSVVQIAGAPLLYEFAISSGAALPVTTLLEYAVAAGEWIGPDAYATRYLQEIDDITIELSGLEAENGEYTCERSAMRPSNAATDTVVVRFTRRGQSTAFAKAVLVYGDRPPTIETSVPGWATASSDVDLVSQSGLTWRGHHLRLARWRETDHQRIAGTTECCLASDLWSTVRVPQPLLSFAALENILRAASAFAPGTCLRISRLKAGPHEGGLLTISGDHAQRRWMAVDASGEVVIAIEGLAFTTGTGAVAPLASDVTARPKAAP